jgi:hypothetical protein
MSTRKNTVKPALRPKRGKRVVENDRFDAFCRRILRAYARRVAAGDVEALRSLAGLASDVDALTRLAVAGLRRSPYSYSWSEIADRLGVSRQAAQMRYGERTRRGRLDHRLIEGGLVVSVATLVEVFTDHHPGSPATSVCPGCGYRYPDGATDCPTLATVRPLLYRRRAEDKQALSRLTPVQYADLHGRTHRGTRAAGNGSARPAPVPAGHGSDLFDLLDRKDPQP